MSTDDPAYFISDAHLGIECPGYEDREQHLLQFLRTLQNRAALLFVVGDLFDFWIEYRHAIRPCYFDVLHVLKLLAESGTTIHYLAGNHDFALGPFLEKTIGMHVYSDHLELTLQGHRLHLHHGDGLPPREVVYRIFRSVLRNRLGQALYRCMHPNLGVPIARFFSGSSRHILKRRLRRRALEAYRRVARSYLKRGSDIVVFGHTHWPELTLFEEGVFCNSGEWIRRYTYAKLEQGAMSLWEYRPDGSSQEIESSSLKRGASAS